MTAANPNNPQPEKTPENQVEDDKAKQRTLQMQLYRNKFMQWWHDYFSMPQVINYAMVIGVALLVLKAVLFGYDNLELGKLIGDLELKTYDLRFKNLPLVEQKYQPSEDIAIIEFDDTSMMVLGEEFGTWPWPREVHAEMMDYFNSVGAKGIVYDIMFVGYQKNLVESDKRFAEAFTRHNNVYIAMNMDNELKEFANVRVSKGVSENEFRDEWDTTIQRVDPLRIDLVSNLLPTSKNWDVETALLPANTQYMFKNSFIVFNHFRSVMPELLIPGQRIGFINHARDNDSISRGNPLFFLLQHQQAVKTKALPLHFDAVKNIWLDAKNNPVTEEGYLLELIPADLKKQEATYKYFPYQKKRELTYKFFPYLAMRYAMDLKYKGKEVKYSVTPQGNLKANNYEIPLRKDGVFLIHWYNQNFYIKRFERELVRLKAYRDELMTTKNPSPQIQQEVKNLNENIIKREQLIAEKREHVKPQPYESFRAIDVITALRNEARGEPSEKDKELKQRLKDKILFVGLTSVAQYDIKSTPVSPHLEGVVVQATLFDNIRQGHFIHQADKTTNTLVWVALCIVSLLIVLRFKQALAALFSVVALGGFYTVFSIILFREYHYWIDLMFPMLTMTAMTMVSLVLKHFIADRAFQATYRMATTDPMTGLYNFRFFKEIMPKAIKEADRTNGKFSLILIDIDFFKKFNDTYGHQAGDEVLRCVARKLRETVRSNDFVIRYGGEEMGIVLDKAPEDVALRVAQKVVEEIAKNPYPIAEGVEKHVTISVGVATYPTHGKNVEELVEFADQGLYRAKDSGRNRVGAQYDDGTVKGAGHAPH